MAKDEDRPALSEAAARDDGSRAGGAPGVTIAGATDIGLVRRLNQDAFSSFEDPVRAETLLVVADGLGGHRGGEVASRMAVDLLGELVPLGDPEPSERLRSSVEHANAEILKAARKDRTLDGMGTTVVCLLVSAAKGSWVAHVGDSRLYRLRAGRLEALTEDHSLVANLVREGAIAPQEARVDPRRNQILRALGVHDDLEVDVAPLDAEPGDAYLLCSDGLHGLLEDDEIQRLMAAEGSPEEIVAGLIDAAKLAGGSDNVTCLLARMTATR